MLDRRHRPDRRVGGHRVRVGALLVAAALVAVTALAALPASAATPVNPDVAPRDVQSLQTATAAFGDTAVNSGIAFTSAGPVALVAHATARNSSGNNVGVTAEILSLPEPAHPWQDIATVDVVDRALGAVSCTCQVTQVQLTGATDFLVQFAYADALGGSVVSDVSGHWFPQPFTSSTGSSSQVTDPVVVADTLFETVRTCVPSCVASPDVVTAWRFDRAAVAFTPAGQTTCSTAGCGHQGGDEGTASCMTSLSGSISPSWLEDFNTALEKAAKKIPSFRFPPRSLCAGVCPPR